MAKKPFALLVFTVAAMITVTAYAAETDIAINSTPIMEKAIEQNGVKLLPMRAILENLNSEVIWNNNESYAEATRNGEYLRVYTKDGKTETGIISTDGEHVPILTENKTAVVKNDTLYIPYSDAAILTRCTIEDNDEINISIPEEADGWIYYASWSDSGRMYKIDTNGQNRQKLSDNDCYNLSVNDGYIYYSIRGEDEDKTYRIKTDGTGEEKLIDEVSDIVYIFDNDDKLHYITDDNCIYYTVPRSDYDFSYYSDLYKLNLTTDKNELIKENISEAVVYDGKVYIANDSYVDKQTVIYAQGADGFEKQAELEGLGTFWHKNGKLIYEMSLSSYATYTLTDDKWVLTEEDSRPYGYTADGNYQIYEDISDENYQIMYDMNTTCFRKTGTDEVKELLPNNFDIESRYREGNTVHFFGCMYENSKQWILSEPGEYKSISINLDNPEDRKETVIDLQDIRIVHIAMAQRFITYTDSDYNLYKMNYDGSGKERLFPPEVFINRPEGKIVRSPLYIYPYPGADEEKSKIPDSLKNTLWKAYDDGRYTQITNEYTRYNTVSYSK